MKKLKHTLEVASDMQNKKCHLFEEQDDKEIIIKMSKSTLFFIILMQLLIVSLFFMLGFILAWNYNTQTTPSSFAKPTQNHQHNQIVQDIEGLTNQPSS